MDSRIVSECDVTFEQYHMYIYKYCYDNLHVILMLNIYSNYVREGCLMHLHNVLVLSVDWRVLKDNFNLLCNDLPQNYHITIDKLKTMLQLSQDERKRLSKLISSSHDVRKINEKILIFLIVKLCYCNNGSSSGLVRLCDVMDELVDSTDSTSCVQKVRNCKCGCTYTHYL